MASVTQYEFLVRYQKRDTPEEHPSWERILSTRTEYAVQEFRYKYRKEEYKILDVYRSVIRDWDKY